MTTPAHEPAGATSDSLMATVGIDNVLAVGAALRAQRDSLQAALDNVRFDLRLGHMGDDPISAYFTPVFQQKVNELADTHVRHVQELTEAVDRLEAAARGYGITEDDIARTFRG